MLLLDFRRGGRHYCCVGVSPCRKQSVFKRRVFAPVSPIAIVYLFGHCFSDLWAHRDRPWPTTDDTREKTNVTRGKRRDTREKKREIFTVVGFRPDETRLTRTKISCTPIDRQHRIAVHAIGLTGAVFEIVDKTRRNTRAHLKSLTTSVV